MLQKKKKKTVW